MGIFLKIREKVLHDSGPQLNYFEMRRDGWLGKRKPWEQDTSYLFFGPFSFFIQHDSNDFSDTTRRIITLVISVSSFVMITGYFCNLMATDMVLVDKPNFMNTYDDILARPGVTALFIKQLSEYEHFRNADKDSKEYKLWKVMTTERSTKANILLDPQGMESMVHLISKVVYGSIVGITSRLFQFTGKSISC